MRMYVCMSSYKIRHNSNNNGHILVMYDKVVSQEVTVTAFVHKKYPMEYVYSTIQGLLSTCMMHN